MKLANVRQRLALVGPRGAVDVETVSRHRFAGEPQAIYDRWIEFSTWVGQHVEEIEAAEVHPYVESDLGAPAPTPRQVFGIGLNYRDHAAEAHLPLPERDPVVFAKFPSSVTGPASVVELPSDTVDFEAELVVVIGTRAHRVSTREGWSHVAGLTLGQDLSERIVQFRGPTPQFSLGKSYPGFAPIGPILATPEEFADANDIHLGCTLNGYPMQQGRTDSMVFTVPELIASLSAVVPLLPGDLIFTGTPAGIGWARNPKIVLRSGDRLVTYADVIGKLTTSFTKTTHRPERPDPLREMADGQAQVRPHRFPDCAAAGDA